ncbi:MAG: S1 RNA-binding domain-containing protein [Clostridia bacterium]|nr:S1 RNA-binding domain-containing protein [Clostridia bacterium]
MREFVFEGGLLHSVENIAACSTSNALEDALKQQKIIEGICCMCDSEMNLHLKLGAVEGIIPKSESAIGAECGKVKDIALISKVGKPVQFMVQRIENTNGHLRAWLSRKAVQRACQEKYINALRSGDIVRVKVTHLERFGAFVDIGAGINSLIPIDMLSVSRIAHPAHRVREGEVLCCAVRSKAEGKITLSLREMLGTWEENACHFEAGQTVKGVVRSVESYGIFIELAPNLAGLAEYNEYVHTGQAVSVYIKSIIPEKMKIKLSIIDVLEEPYCPQKEYYYQGAHMDVWQYSPTGCEKVIETVFAK